MLTDPELYHLDDNDFKLVIPKKNRKTYQRYSRLCENRFHCLYGLKCNYAHTDEEKEYFRENPHVKNRALYKSIECGFGNGCKYKLEGRDKMCPFAHGLIEARCLSCKKIGSHWTDECIIPRDYKAMKQYYTKPGK